MHVFLGLIGLVLVCITASEAFEVMLLPRRIRRSLRFVNWFFNLSWRAWAWSGKRLSSSSRAGFFSLYGPLSMTFLLTWWAVGLIVGIGLIQFALQSQDSKPLTLISALYFSGTSFFTVGYGDVLPTNHFSKSLAVIEAGTGLAFIACIISYLPVLYQVFSRRESQVIQLDARAGSPPSGLALLCRHADQDALEELQFFLRGWEEWCSTLIESHLSYPMLSYYRSQHDNQSWLAALNSVLDCCAIILTGISDLRTFSAKMTFATARLATVEVCETLNLRPIATKRDRLPADHFPELERRLNERGLFFTDPGDAEGRLAELRNTYEPLIAALARHLALDLGPWIPDDHERDNWQQNRRGRQAKKLLDSVPAQPSVKV